MIVRRLRGLDGARDATGAAVIIDVFRAFTTAAFWWMSVGPGLGIFLAVFAFNYLGDALRDALDPRLRRSG